MLDTQTTFEGPPPKAKLMPISRPPRLETMDEVPFKSEQNTIDNDGDPFYSLSRNQKSLRSIPPSVLDEEGN